MGFVRQLRQGMGKTDAETAGRLGAKRAQKSSWGWGRKAKHLDQFDSAAYQYGYQFFP